MSILVLQNVFEKNNNKKILTDDNEGCLHHIKINCGTNWNSLIDKIRFHRKFSSIIMLNICDEREGYGGR